MYELLIEQLRQMELVPEHISENSCTNRTAVYTVVVKGKPCRLEVYRADGEVLSIRHHLLLEGIGVRVPTVVAHTECAIIYEDRTAPDAYRPANEKDFRRKKTAAALGAWYKTLHEKGCELLRQTPEQFPVHALTKERLQALKARSATENNPAWVLLEDNIDSANLLLERAEETLVCVPTDPSDFWISKDEKEILPVRYDILDRGMSLSDVLALQDRMERKAASAFLKAYGALDDARVELSLISRDLRLLSQWCDGVIGETEAASAVERLRLGETYQAARKIFRPEMRF